MAIPTESSLTTPGALDLHPSLEVLANNKITHCILEASSHGIHQVFPISFSKMFVSLLHTFDYYRITTLSIVKGFCS
jgi:hypothetical protein